jgi:hypothetical protein
LVPFPPATFPTDHRELSAQAACQIPGAPFRGREIAVAPHLISPIQEFFAVPDFRQIIVIVDVNAKLDFLQLRAGWPFILGMLGDIVPELSKVDDLADRRGGRWGDPPPDRDQDLSFAQGVI